MQIIKNYVRENSTLLFNHKKDNNQMAIFDAKGFYFAEETQAIYNRIKNQPHLYVAWTENQEGHYYIGKSFQNGGRWKRQHAYHLGTLAYHLLNTIRYDDQNHAHWIMHWMRADSINVIDSGIFSVELKDPVYICFIPFEIYSNYNTLIKTETRKINTSIEKQLIKSYQDDNIHLLNVQHN
jgi:hypothetical protein